MRRHRSCQSLTQQKAELTPEAMATVQPEKDLSSTWCVSSLACAKHPECLRTGMPVLHTAPDQRNRIGDFDSSWALCTPPPVSPSKIKSRVLHFLSSHQTDRWVRLPVNPRAAGNLMDTAIPHLSVPSRSNRSLPPDGTPSELV